MPGKLYYLTTLAAWQRHAHRFTGSHWIVLNPNAQAKQEEATSPPPADVQPEPSDGAENSPLAPQQVTARALNPSPLLAYTTPILVLVEADEGAHLALESDADFQPLPHPLAQKAVPASAQSAIAARGIAIPDRATTFEVAESLARVHPLLRHRVF